MDVETAEIAARLRHFGEERYRSMAEFARALAMRPQALHSYLSGRSKPGPSIQKKLRSVGCDVEWLMTGRKSESPPGLTREQAELLQFMGELGIDTVEKARSLYDPENLAKDLALVLRERVQKYRRKDRPG